METGSSDQRPGGAGGWLAHHERGLVLRYGAAAALGGLALILAYAVPTLANLKVSFVTFYTLLIATSAWLGDHVRFTVHDTGCGLTKAELPHLFERFFRAPRALGGGTGLGLYISKAIVEAHGGTIRAESAEGAGSTFSFTLPAG
jgi:signal transduction histidine kinase